MTRVTVVTLCSEARLAHLENQLHSLGSADASTLVVWLDADEPPALAADTVLHVPPGPHGFRLAAARNAGADRAVASGAELVVFLDADCVPGPELVARYEAALVKEPEAVLCGPVTYLPPDVDARHPALLGTLTAPHPARPAPAPGVTLRAPWADYTLFWSLSFALGAASWRRGPRFDEEYEGYGGEDTDFAFRLRRNGIPLVWVGGADAYHQWHPTTSPPFAHLDDILRNGALFAATWGEWPMGGWLEQFEAAGVVRRTAGGWVRTAGGASRL